MERIASGIGATLVLVVALVLFTGSGRGYGQNTTPSNTCEPFQLSLSYELIGGTTGQTSVRVTPGRILHIETVALRIDANTYVAPAIAGLTTTVRSVTSGYYLPIPSDMWLVQADHPLTLTQPVHVYAEGGTDVTLYTSIDQRYVTGSGRAEWSVSGQRCTA